MSVSIRDIHWTAGFLEGDGSFLFGTNRTPLITAAQVQRWPLEKLQCLYGGKINLTIYKNRPKWSNIYRWSLTGERAAGLMMTLYPLMWTRRRGQILLALGGWKAAPVPKKYRTHCERGHEYTESNTYRHENSRQCRQCMRIYDQNRRSR